MTINNNYLFDLYEENYDLLVDDIRTNGVEKSNRTNVNTISLFDNKSWSDHGLLSNGYFPLLRRRKIYWKGALVELFWILGILQKQNPIIINGKEIDRNNIKYLEREGCNYWNPWADENGDLGPVYGAQLDNWNNDNINQLDILINKLRNNPDDRRLVCSMWNPSQLKDMALPPCHYCFECYSFVNKEGERELKLRWIQRSIDVLLGLPYDICLYSFLLIMLAKLTNHKVGRLYASLGDAHIYKNQLKCLDSLSPIHCLHFNTPPTYKLNDNKEYNNFTDFTLDDFIIENYKYDKVLKVPVNV